MYPNEASGELLGAQPSLRSRREPQRPCPFYLTLHLPFSSKVLVYVTLQGTIYPGLQGSMSRWKASRVRELQGVSMMDCLRSPPSTLKICQVLQPFLGSCSVIA